MPISQGPRSKFNPIPRGAAPRDWIELDLGPRDEAWIFQSMNYFFDRSTFQFVQGEFDPISSKYIR